MEFIIHREIFNNVTGLKVGVIVIENADNTVDIGDFVEDEFTKTAGYIRSKFDGVELAEYPVIKKWREVYRGFGEKKARSSIESLIRRVAGGKDIYNINPLVDIYNLASLKFELPCGGEDTDAMDADLELTFADGNEKFIPLGGVEEEHPSEGEIIYRSGDTAVCRNFNYRESDVTKLTGETKNAIIVFEDIGGDGSNLISALKWTVEKAESLLGAEIIAITVLDDSESGLSINSNHRTL